MKIYEIIAEAPEYTTPGGIVIPSGAKTAAPLSKTAPSTTITKAVGKDSFSETARLIAKKSPKQISATLKQAILGKAPIKNPTEAAKATKFLTKGRLNAMANLGKVLVLLKWLALGAEEIYQLWAVKAYVQALVDADVLSEEEGDAVIDEEVGQFVAIVVIGMIIPKMLMSAKLVNIILWILKIGGIAGAAVSMGATLSVFVASQAAQIWLTQWLQSASGREALSQYLGGVLSGTGWMARKGLSALTGGLASYKVTKNKTDAEKAKDKEKEAEPEPIDTPQKRAARGGRELTPDEIAAQQAKQPTSNASAREKAADAEMKRLGL